MIKTPIAFADLHGCYPAAERAVRLAEEFGAQAIFLGDYIDRGPSGVKTLQVLCEAKAKHPDWVFLRGNHDQMLLDLISGKNKTDDLGVALDGAKFNYSQSEGTFNEWKVLDHQEQKRLLSFLLDSVFYYETDDFIFLHSILRNTRQNLSEKSPDEFLWNYSHEPVWNGKPFIHGHYPIEQIELRDNSINLNTFCGYGGKLTGLLIDLSKGDGFRVFEISEDGCLLDDFFLHQFNWQSFFRISNSPSHWDNTQ